MLFFFTFKPSEHRCKPIASYVDIGPDIQIQPCKKVYSMAQRQHFRLRCHWQTHVLRIIKEPELDVVFGSHLELQVDFGNPRPVWSTQQVPVEPEIHSERLCQTKQNKTTAKIWPLSKARNHTQTTIPKPSPTSTVKMEVLEITEKL